MIYYQICKDCDIMSNVQYSVLMVTNWQCLYNNINSISDTILCMDVLMSRFALDMARNIDKSTCQLAAYTNW